MTIDLAHVPVDDAERLEHRWGVRVAMEMLHEGLISASDFLWLCEEAADAPVIESPDPQRSHGVAGAAV